MAYKPPQVQTMSQAMKDLNPAYAAVTQNLNQQQALVPQKYDAQRSAINAERGQGFNAINNQATARGGSFSGVPVNEQSVYLATKYLPGLQQADFQQNAEQLEIAGRLADIEKEKRTTALNTINQQKSDLTSWNSARAAEQAAAREAEKQRQFTASQSAISRAASAPKKLTPYESAMGIIGAAVAKGSVSSNAFQLARDAYRAAGGDVGQFATEFWKYVPKSQQTGDKWKEYYYG
jgi:hypothetical protein